MNIPSITSIETALEVYYRKLELGNKDLETLFGKRSSATICKLKKAVKAEMVKKNIYSYGGNKINTVVAFMFGILIFTI